MTVTTGNKIEFAGSLSVRNEPIGGGVLKEVKVVPEHWYVGMPTVVLLVHGYNVTRGEALKSYRHFLDLMPPRVNGLFGTGLWPGDADWFSGIQFPLKVKTAITSGEVFATFLRRLRRISPATRVIVVAHSLGCRVILEMLRELQIAPPREQPRIDLVYLMAAAVPVGHLHPGGRLVAAKGAVGKCIAFHSIWDLVLQVLFRLGEPVASVMAPRREGGIHFKAVGVHGEPQSYWANTEDCYPNGHGDYWPDGRIARMLARELGAAPRNLIAERPLITRSAAPTHSTPVRTIGRRNVGRDT